MSIDGFRIPILIIAFNRPETIRAQLRRIDYLGKRRIHISVDGPRNVWDETAVDLVKSNVFQWAGNTHHEVSVNIQDLNLGLHKHSQVAYQDFFSQISYGLVLEDDIEFRKSFVDFLDSQPEIISQTRSWSIEGHNPSISARSNFASNQQVSFRPTHIHTIWGWASSSVNIESFLSYLNRPHTFRDLNKTIENFAESITSDKLLRNAIRATWLRKTQRAVSGGGSWDNWWELAAWDSGQRSLIPDVSLSREVLNQHEGQSHAHHFDGDPWEQESIDSVRLGPLRYSRNEKGLDVELLRIWGISRKYSWARANLIQRQISELHSSFLNREAN